MESESWLVVISNRQQYDFLKQIQQSTKGVVLKILFDVSRTGYFGGKIPEGEHIALNLSGKLSRLISERALWKKALRDVSGFTRLITFSEGGCAEWVYLSAAKQLGVPSLCIQWSITWRPEFYASNYSALKRVVLGLKKTQVQLSRWLFGIRGRPMSYLGDGMASHLLTVGDFWTNQFKDAHSSAPEKFKTFGLFLPKFKQVKQTCVLFILGAEGGLGYSSSQAFLHEFKTTIGRVRTWVDDSYEVIVRAHPREIEQNLQSIKQIAFDCGVTVEDAGKEIDLSNCKAVFVKRSTLGFQVIHNQCPLFVYGDAKKRGFDFALNSLGIDFEQLDQAQNSFQKSCEDSKSMTQNLSKFITSPPDIDVLRRI